MRNPDTANRRSTDAADAPTAHTGERLPAAVRRQRIQQMLKADGFISVAKIAAQLGVSAMSVRRDLDQLAKAGELVRSYGTAVPSAATAQSTATGQHELQYETRRRRGAQAKDDIARAAAELIKPAEMVALDVGSTVLALARVLAGRPGLRVYTNHLRAATVLASADAEVVMPGGSVRPHEMSICGATAVDHVRMHWFAQAFIGVSGINDEGCFDYSNDDSQIKRAYIERAERCVVLCDASKFDSRSVVRVCTLDQIGLLITNAKPPAGLAAALKKAGVEVLVV